MSNKLTYIVADDELAIYGLTLDESIVWLDRLRVTAMAYRHGLNLGSAALDMLRASARYDELAPLMRWNADMSELLAVELWEMDSIAAIDAYWDAVYDTCGLDDIDDVDDFPAVDPAYL